MAKWYTAGYEARFKPVPGGYVFQPPAFIGDGRNHLVNEAQKTAIMNILERWVLLFILVSLAVPLMLELAIGLIAAVAAIWHPSISEVTAVVFILAIAYARRKLRLLLATLPTTEERITFREQTEMMARNLPGALLGVGFGLGVTMIVFSITEKHEPALWFAMGTVLIAHFVWLIVLRKRKHGDAA